MTEQQLATALCLNLSFGIFGIIIGAEMARQYTLARSKRKERIARPDTGETFLQSENLEANGGSKTENYGFSRLEKLCCTVVAVAITVVVTLYLKPSPLSLSGVLLGWFIWMIVSRFKRT